MTSVFDLAPPPDSCRWVTEELPHWVVVEVEGDVDAALAGDLEAVLNTYLGGRRPVLADMAAVAFVDLGAAAVLRSAHQCDDRFGLLAPSDAVRRKLFIAGVQVPCYEHVDDALEAWFGWGAAALKPQDRASTALFR